MKSFVKSLFFVSGFLFLSSGLYAQSLAEIKAEIEQINKILNKAIVKGDMNAGLAYYSDDIISMPNWSPMLRGKEAIKEENQAMMAQGVKFNSFQTKTMEVLGAGNFIIEIGEYSLSMEMHGVPQEINDNGKYLTVWEKQKDGSMKIKIETWNTNQNPMAMMQGGSKKPKHDLKDMKGKDTEEKRSDIKSRRR